MLYIISMYHFESFIRLIIVIVGFTYLTALYFYSGKLRTRVSKFYFVNYLCLYLYHVITFTYRYLDLTIPQSEINYILILLTISFISLWGFVWSCAGFTLSALDSNRKGLYNLLKIVITLFYLGLFLSSISLGSIEVISYKLLMGLLLYGQLLQVPVFIVCLILLFRKRELVREEAIRKQLKVYLLIELIYLPFMLYEKIFINITYWYPVATDLRVYHLTFIVWSVASAIIFMKGMRLGGRSNHLSLLSTREREVYELVLKNKSSKEIGEELFISPRTVEKHTSNIYKKLDVKNRNDLLKN